MEDVKKDNSTVVPTKKVVQQVQSTNVVMAGKEYEDNNPIPEDLGDRWLRWKCLKCGFVYEGTKPLNVCPKCGNNDLDMFGDVS
ncbi:hypothetical protein K8R20_00770 [bacterium]|nr:hypothetical protein [bacterium]